MIDRYEDLEPLRLRWRKLVSSPAAYRSRVAERETKIHALIEFRAPDPSGIPATGPLSGLPFAVKNNIAAEGWNLTCGSRMLAELPSPYSATAVSRLAAAGAVVVGTANLDEFGMGSSTENSFAGPTFNPWDLSRTPGGSSGGSAAAVASGEVPFALGTDTGGSVRQPAAFCGVYGLKPTYGAVSRFGLVAYASSLECIGVLAESPELAEAVFECMRGIDPEDHTSAAWNPPPDRQIRTVAVLRDTAALSDEVRAVYERSIASLGALGYETVPVELPALEYAAAAYYTIATAEASANLARFDGIRYGLRPYYAESPERLVTEARTKGFGSEVKQRIMLGTFVLREGFRDQFYNRAQMIRAAIGRELDRVFETADVLLSPVYPVTAFKPDDPEMDGFTQKKADMYTVMANLAGLPALSFPAGLSDGLPVGLQVTAPAFAESLLFRFAERFREVFPPPVCPLRDSEQVRGRGGRA
jgi:aspartyl-tRNA(Asn)/glutamyl-tRNA(Gln) amidotransferase subunit A